MNRQWETHLDTILQKRRDEHLYRSLRIVEESQGAFITIDGKQLVNFAGNDYLGLSHDNRLLEAGITAARRFGSGSGASRLISGSHAMFSRFEDEVSRWLGYEKVLFFNSGYHANLGLLSALADRKTVVFCDRLNHASIYDGIALSRGQMIRFPHRDITALEKLLARESSDEKKICVSDALFSMDGDLAPVDAMADLGEKHNLLTIIDEAHSIGVFGKEGRGLVHDTGCSRRIDAVVGTLGKGFGIFGAFVAGDGLLIDYLVNNCRPFIFTTALPPFVVGAALEALHIIRNEDRGAEVLKKAAMVRQALQSHGIDTGSSMSQIIPVITGTNQRALELQSWYRENGVYIPAIRPPTVPEGTSRVRISLSWLHGDDEIEKLVDMTVEWFKQKGDQ